jgi:hypothetical protein
MADDLMFLQLMEEDEDLEEEHLELQAVVVSGMVVYRAESCHLHAERWYHHHLYLIHTQLLPNPHEATPGALSV